MDFRSSALNCSSKLTSLNYSLKLFSIFTYVSSPLLMQSIHQPPSPPILVSFKNSDELVNSLAIFVEKAQRDSINKKGRFTIALSGGSQPKMLRGLINNPHIKWDQWSFLLSLLFFSFKFNQIISRIGMFTM